MVMSAISPMATNPMFANLARSRIMSDSVEGYQLLKLAGKSGSQDSLRKPLSVRFKSRRARGSRRTVSRWCKGSRQLLRKCIAKGAVWPPLFFTIRDRLG